MNLQTPCNSLVNHQGFAKPNLGNPDLDSSFSSVHPKVLLYYKSMAHRPASLILNTHSFIVDSLWRDGAVFSVQHCFKFMTFTQKFRLRYLRYNVL